MAVSGGGGVGGGAVGVGLGLVASVLAFVLTLPLLRALPPNDAAWLQRLVGSRWGGVPARLLQACTPRSDRSRLGEGRAA